MTRTSVLLGLLSLSLGACGGSKDVSCDGACGSFIVNVKMVDATNTDVDCATAGIKEFELSFTGDDGRTDTRTIACDAANTNVGRFAVDRKLTIAARALASDGTVHGRGATTDQISTAEQVQPVNLVLVAGAPSQLAAACNGEGCPDGYGCVHVQTSGGGDIAFCTAGCGTSPMTAAPRNGDFVCAAGYGGTGRPVCALYGEGAGDVKWSCLVQCKTDDDCTGGTTCQTGLSRGSVCGTASGG